MGACSSTSSSPVRQAHVGDSAHPQPQQLNETPTGAPSNTKKDGGKHEEHKQQDHDHTTPPHVPSSSPTTGAATLHTPTIAVRRGSILKTPTTAKKERITAVKYIAGSNAGKAVPAVNESNILNSTITAIDNTTGVSTTTPVVDLRVSGSPKAGSIQPAGTMSGSQNHKRRSNRRSSDGRRLTGDRETMAQVGIDGTNNNAPPEASRRLSRNPANNGPPGLPRKHSTSTTHHHAHHGHHNSHSHHKRRTSNNGMISRLALQFPLIRTSFFAVYRAFAQYMAIIHKAEEEMEKRKSWRGGEQGGGGGSGITVVPVQGAVVVNGSPFSSAAHSNQQPPRSTTEIQLVDAAGGTIKDMISIEEDIERQREVDVLLKKEGGGGGLLQVNDPTVAVGATLGSVHSSPSFSAISSPTSSTLLQPPPILAPPPLLLTPKKVKSLGTLPINKLGEALSAISGVASLLTQSEIDEIFSHSNLSHSSTGISFREFLIATALGYFLKDDLQEAKRELMEQQAAAAAGIPWPPLEGGMTNGPPGLMHASSSSSSSGDPRGSLNAGAGTSLPPHMRSSSRRPSVLAGPIRRPSVVVNTGATGGLIQPVAPSPRRAISLNVPATQGSPGVTANSNVPPSPKRLELNVDPISNQNGHPVMIRASTVQEEKTSSSSFGTNSPAAPSYPRIQSHPSPHGGHSIRPSAASNTSALSSPIHGSGPIQLHRSPSSSTNSTTRTLRNKSPVTIPNHAHLSFGAGSPTNATNNASSTSSSDFYEVQKGFRVVFHAFRDMDEDSSGGVSISELKHALFASSNLKNDTALLETRFKELDFDDGGEIDFPEFLFGLCSWVGLMDEDDVDG